MSELQHSKLGREYDLLLSELMSVLHLDGKTIAPNTLKHTVTVMHFLCEFLTVISRKSDVKPTTR